MFTLNKLNILIKDYVASHKQIVTYRFEEDEAPSNTDYPLIEGVLMPCPIESTEEQTVIKFYVLDRVLKGVPHRVEVLSDTKLMCLDFLSFFKQTKFSEFLNIKQSTTLNPFIGQTDDEVTGWWFEVIFSNIFEWDVCNIPKT